MKKTIVIAGILLAAAAAAPSAHAANGKAVWQQHCKMCHGPDGKGNTPMGKKLDIRDLTDPKVEAAFTDAQATKDVKEGIKVEGRKRMPGFANKLNDQEIKSVIDYLREFKKG